MQLCLSFLCQFKGLQHLAMRGSSIGSTRQFTVHKLSVEMSMLLLFPVVKNPEVL